MSKKRKQKKKSNDITLYYKYKYDIFKNLWENDAKSNTIKMRVEIFDEGDGIKKWYLVNKIDIFQDQTLVDNNLYKLVRVKLYTSYNNPMIFATYIDKQDPKFVYGQNIKLFKAKSIKNDANKSNENKTKLWSNKPIKNAPKPFHKVCIFVLKYFMENRIYLLNMHAYCIKLVTNIYTYSCTYIYI